MEGTEISHHGSSERIDYDLEKEIEEFEEAKAGVKGLVDSGIAKIPRIFYSSRKNPVSLPTSNEGLAQLQVPVMDFSIAYPRMVEQVREAAESWGFFQIVNHGVPLHIMDEILEGTRRFHEQPRELKKSLYTSDVKQRVMCYSNGLLRSTKHAD